MSRHERDAARTDRTAGIDEAPGTAPAPVHEVIALQRSAGNAAVARWLLQRETPTDTGTATSTDTVTPTATPTTPEAPADTEKIAALRKELSARFNVTEENVISLMKSLSSAEVDTVLGDAWIKSKTAGCLNDDEMYGVVRAMHGDPVKSLEWLKDTQTKYKFARSAQTGLGDVKLDPKLDEAVTNLVQHLLDNYMVNGNASFDGIGGVREPQTAHRNSTAYHIRTGVVTLDALKALPNGKDQEGTLWYKEGWTEADAKENAVDVWDGKIAYEGYGPTDPKRLPNAAEVPMSPHCTGQAMDVTIPWRDGDGWHPGARDLVKQFGLARPLDPDERWHFELPGASP